MIYLFYEFGISRDGYGGGQEILLQISKIHLEKSIDFKIFIPTRTNQVNVEKSLEEKIVYVRDSSNPLLVGIRLAMEFIRNLSLKEKPNKVIVFTSEAFLIALLCKILKIRCISYIAAPKIPLFRFSLDNLKNIKNNIQLFLFLLGAKFCSINYAISKEIKSQCLNSIFGFKDDEIVIAYPGIDKIYKRRSFSACSKRGNLLYLGRICTQQKSTDLILKALKIVKKKWNEFFIIGSGNLNEEKKIKQLILNRSLKSKVKVIATSDKNQIRKLASKSSVAIMTSNYESFQIAAYEMINQVDNIILSDVADHKILMPKSNTVNYARSNRYHLSRIVERNLTSVSTLSYKYKKNRLNALNKKIAWEKLVDSLS
ncbi:glycosyltransferase [Polynucleobacter sp. MWH-UH23A]|uniref:glycosyltransferase n=1 Tax=Polynucleobacter sp. MWH-UH23A TaxID=1855613 RepID=UPI00336516DB